MYGKEEFIDRLREKKYYNTLLEWLEWFSNPNALREIHRRHDDMPDNMPECYVWECAKWYIQVKMCDVHDFTFRKNGMTAEEEVYHYPPYHPGAFLATLYAIFACDPYRWTQDDDKFYKLEAFMKKNGFLSFYNAIRTIIDHNELPPRPRFAGRAAFSIAGNRAFESKMPQDKKGSGKTKDEQTTKLPEDVTLTESFSQELQTNKTKRMAFLKVMREEVKPKVLEKKGSRDLKWKWPHVQSALFKSKHIVSDETNAEFGREMELVTGEKAHNVEQSFKRFNERPTDANIILAIQKVVDEAIANATKANNDKKNEKEIAVNHDVINPILNQLMQPILLLEPYYYPNCTKEMVIEGFQSLSRKYVPEHFVDVEKRIRKTSFNFITALQDVRFIRDNVPALEMGFHLKQLYDDLQPMDICRGLMHSVDERLPESVNMLLTQFRFDMQHILKKANVHPEEVEEVETVAHRQYIEYLNAKEANMIERLVRKTLCFSSYFQYYVKEQDVWDMYNRMFCEITLVASVHRAFQETRIDTAVCKVVGVLREVGIIKDGVPVRQLAECFTSTSMHYESIRKAITIGFDRDRMLHDFIYDFWMRRYLPD